MRDDLEEEVEREVKLEGSSTVSDLLDQEGIEREEVLVSRNGTVISGKHELKEGDEIKILDVIAGG